MFLAGYDLTPTMRDINKKFSVKYYLNLVLVDEEERRYFKQQEITLWRKGERVRKGVSASNSVYQVPHAMARHNPGEQPSQNVRTAPTPSEPNTPISSFMPQVEPQPALSVEVQQPEITSPSLISANPIGTEEKTQESSAASAVPEEKEPEEKEDNNIPVISDVPSQIEIERGGDPVVDHVRDDNATVGKDDHENKDLGVIKDDANPPVEKQNVPMSPDRLVESPPPMDDLTLEDDDIGDNVQEDLSSDIEEDEFEKVDTSTNKKIKKKSKEPVPS